MSESLMQILAMGGNDRAPRVSPELLKRLKQFSLNATDITTNLKRFRRDAFVIAHNTDDFLRERSLTPGKMYPIDDIDFNEEGTAICVTITDDQQLRHRSSVLLLNTLEDLRKEEHMSSEYSLVLILDEIRSLLADKWSGEMTMNVNQLQKCFASYGQSQKFNIGDLVVYKENMMVIGALSRRGVGIVIGTPGDLGTFRDPKTREQHDTLIGVFDEEGDFSTMSIYSGRLERVPVTQVGSYKNPFMLRKHRSSPTDRDEQDTETSESSEA